MGKNKETKSIVILLVSTFSIFFVVIPALFILFSKNRLDAFFAALTIEGFLFFIGFLMFVFNYFNAIDFKTSKWNKKTVSLVITAILSVLLILIDYLISSRTDIYTISKIFCQFCALSFLIPIFRKIKTIVSKNASTNGNSQSFFEEKSFWIPAITLSLIIVYIFTSPFFRQFTGYHRLQKEPVGAVRAYYVIAENKKGKEYTLPAEVGVSYDTDTDLKYNPTTFTDEETTSYFDLFLISRVYFKNGGYLYFEDPLVFSKPGDKAIGYDQSDKKWHITLTDRYVKNSNIKERNPYDLKDFIFWVSVFALAFIQWILLFIKYTKDECVKK